VRVLLVMAGDTATHQVMTELDAADELELVGVADSKDAALALAGELQPEVALVHSDLPAAAETAQLLKERSLAVLVLTTPGSKLSDTLIDEQVVAAGYVDTTATGTQIGSSVAIAAVLAAAMRAADAQSEG
jgi:chemotaxis response regulator CheB